MDDFARLERSIKRMEKFPTKYLTAAVKKGANPILKDAKANAPEDTGLLKKAMILKLEKTKTKGKKTYQVTFDKAYNEQLAKTSKGGKRSYYPASQEFGWIKKDGTKVPGKHFIRNAGDSNEGKFQKTVIDEMMKKIAKEWKYG
jgi:HK97 gp10 family phage protein